MDKLSDFLAKYISKIPVNCIFGVQGGAVVHIFDSLHQKTNIPICYTHHEQAAALAAVSNAKAHDTIGVCIVTTGPAATNAITGLLAAWQDSVPVIFISGQTRAEQTSYQLNVRQRGSQECNIIDVISPWVKKAYFVDKPEKINNILDSALEECISDRKGPVWIDLPVNLQWQKIKNNLKLKIKNKNFYHKNQDSLQIVDCIEKIKRSKKPLFILGRPVRNKKYLNKFLKKLSENNIPVVHTWGSCNNFTDGLLNVGIIGVSGQMAANIAIRASDKPIFLGCHFSTTQSGNSFKSISKSQVATFINTDKRETSNLANNIQSEIINTDVDYFMKVFIDTPLNDFDKQKLINWKSFLIEISTLISPEKACSTKKFKNFINPHYFINNLYKNLNKEDCVVIDGGGTALYAGFQCIPNNSKFNIFCSTSISAMGTGLPELCGASIGNKFKRCFCIVGDGSLMFNLQELQTLKTNCPSSIIIVLNNQGYLAIRHTQKEFLKGRFYGTSDEDKNIEIPNIEDIAKTFKYKYKKISSSIDIDQNINQIINVEKSHLLVELICPPEISNLYTPSFKKNNDGSFSPNDIDHMKPFEDFNYKKISQKNNLDIEL